MGNRAMRPRQLSISGYRRSLCFFFISWSSIAQRGAKFIASFQLEGISFLLTHLSMLSMQFASRKWVWPSMATG
jgi:hypothetical protein